MKFKLLSGTYRSKSGLVTAGQIIETESDMIARFGKMWERVIDPAPALSPLTDKNPPEEKTVEETPAAPRIVHKGGGKYDVIGASGEKLNRRILSKKAAEDLMASLSNKSAEE